MASCAHEHKSPDDGYGVGRLAHVGHGSEPGIETEVLHRAVLVREMRSTPGNIIRNQSDSGTSTRNKFSCPVISFYALFFGWPTKKRDDTVGAHAIGFLQTEGLDRN